MILGLSGGVDSSVAAMLLHRAIGDKLTSIFVDNGLLRKEKTGAGNLINDAMQGTKGIFNFPLNDDDFKFLGFAKTGPKA